MSLTSTVPPPVPTSAEYCATDADSQHGRRDFQSSLQLDLEYYDPDETFKTHELPLEKQEELSPTLRPGKACGINKRTFFISLILAISTCAAIITATVFGALLSRYKENIGNSAPSPPSPSATSTSNTTVISHSRLSAINWTDETGTVEYYGVFWQNSRASLVMSLWDSSNKSWETINISEHIAASNPTINLLPGTPITAAVRTWPWTTAPYSYPFGIALFFLSTTNTIQELYSTDSRGASWALGDLVTSDTTYTTGNGSSLGVWWSLCTSNCSNELYLFYQDPEQNLRLANQSDWGASPLTLAATPMMNSGLGVTAVLQHAGEARISANAVKIYFDVSSLLSEMDYSSESAYFTTAGTISKDMTDSPPKIAAQGFSDPRNQRGLVQIFVPQIYSNGTIRVNYWDDSQARWHTSVAPILQGLVVSNWVDLAVTGDMQVFGITDTGEIHHYSVNTSSPISWTYVEQVTVSGT